MPTEENLAMIDFFEVGISLISTTPTLKKLVPSDAPQWRFVSKLKQGGFSKALQQRQGLSLHNETIIIGLE